MSTDPLRPWQPDEQSPWTPYRAASLLRRAGFSPTWEAINAAVSAGPAATVDGLLDPGPDSPRHDELDGIGEHVARGNDIGALRAWWLARMVHTAHPLRARIAAFWHGHFATSNSKVRDPLLMYRQLRLIERHGLGDFESLTIGMARDPAMIVWLDGNANINGRPNENFARELFELFMLGIGNYNEVDIKEAARCFTGWHQRHGRYRFAEHLHDRGTKSLFGHVGQFDGDDVVAMALDHPACATFLARRLLEEFHGHQPSAAFIDAMAHTLRRNSYNIGETLKTLFASVAMLEDCRPTRIKSPVEFAIGLTCSLHLSVPGPELAESTSQMGQRLFEPPSVKGWDGHRAWLNTTTMLVRLNTAERTCRSDRLDVEQIIDRYDLASRDAVIDWCVQVVLGGEAPSALRRTLEASIADSREEAMRDVLRILLVAPEYQFS